MSTALEVMQALRALAAWTPYLLAGFAWNIVVALAAMLLGTVLGAVLAWLRTSQRDGVRYGTDLLAEFSRSTPTIVLQYYLAVMLPTEWVVPGTAWVLAIPAWVKASLALSLAVVGFTADNLRIALRAWADRDRSLALLFVPAWGSYLLIIVIASSTASLIGVPELVSRANIVIAATGNTGLMVPTYLYACLIFFCFCWPLVTLLRMARRAFAQRLAGAISD